MKIKFKFLPKGAYLPPVAKIFYYPVKWILYAVWSPVYFLIWFFTPRSKRDIDDVYLNIPRDVFKETGPKFFL